MNETQRLKLQEMVTNNNVEDQTNLIRQLKHSDILKNQIDILLSLKEQYGDDSDKIHLEAMNDCNFLFTYYTDIYNKVRKNEIDLHLLNQMLNVLKDIENEKMDQHEGSFKVGTILKEIYVDSALKKSEKMDKDDKLNKLPITLKQNIPISWSEYKQKFYF